MEGVTAAIAAVLLTGLGVAVSAQVTSPRLTPPDGDNFFYEIW